MLIALGGVLGAQQSSGYLVPAFGKTDEGKDIRATHTSMNGAWFVQTLKLPNADLDVTAVEAKNNRPVRGLTTTVTRATHWAQQALMLVVKYQQNPLRASRVLAHLQVAQHDAWLHAARLSKQDAARETAAHRAASLVLDHFYPNETPGRFESQYAWLRSHLALDEPNHKLAETVGSQVAAALVNRSLRDGAGRTWPLKNRPLEFAGMWQAAYPLYAVNPAEAFAGDWMPWVTPQPNRYQPPTAARPGSTMHRQETIEVQRASEQVTPMQRDTAQRWNLAAGSVTPGGIWMQHTIDQFLLKENGSLSGSGPSFEECLAVLAPLSIALVDALIACWKIKFRDWSERPITSIRRDFDKNFVSPLITPGFPSYVSGHATISAAAARVLSGFWPAEAVTLNAMAQEAAMSRLWGGIHFRSDNEEGLRLGDAVGKEVLLKSAAKRSTQ